jgi:hypothetical protein
MARKARTSLAQSLKRAAKECGTYGKGSVNLTKPRTKACIKASRQLIAAIRRERSKR